MAGSTLRPAERTRMDELESQLRNGQPGQRLDAASAIFRIGSPYGSDSPERSSVANILFRAFIDERDERVRDALERDIRRLGFRVESQLEQAAPDSSDYKTTYSMTGPVLPRPRRVPPRPRRATQEEERRQLPKPSPPEEQRPQQQPIPEDYTRPPPLAEAEARRLATQSEEMEKQRSSPAPTAPPPARERTLTGAIAPPSRAKRAEDLASRLPPASTAAGAQAMERIDHEELVENVLARMIASDMEQSRPIPVPSFEEHAARYQLGVDVPGLGRISIPVYSPEMYQGYGHAVREARQAELLRPISAPPSPDMPESGEGTRSGERSHRSVDADAVFRSMDRSRRPNALQKRGLISIIEDPSANWYDRVVAAHEAGWNKCAECVPLLAAVLHGPEKHGAFIELTDAAGLALLEIGTEEAIRELKKNPNDYARALAAFSINHPSIEHETELVNLLTTPLLPATKTRLAASLVVLGRREGMAFIESQLRHPPSDEEQRRQMANELRSISWIQGVEMMLVSMSGANGAASTRAIIATALGDTLGERGIRTLVRLMDDPDLAVRMGAGESLARLYMDARLLERRPDLPEMAYQALRRVARTGEIAAVLALAEIGAMDKEMLSALRLATHYPDETIRRRAVAGILESTLARTIPPATAVDYLEQMTVHGGTGVIEAIMNSLVEISENISISDDLRSRIGDILSSHWRNQATRKTQ